MSEGTIDISGLDKAELLAALHAGSHAQGMSVANDHGPATVEQARDDWAERESNKKLAGHRSQFYFDYYRGRVLKVNLGGDDFESYLYDCDNYEGAAATVVEKLR